MQRNSSAPIRNFNEIQGGENVKRIKSICTRVIAIILSAFILSCTLIADFEKPVYATGVEESLYYGLRALIQTVMLSQGYSYSSTSDLDTSTKGLENLIKSYKDSADFSDAVALTGLFNWVAGKKIGDKLDSITDHAGLITYVKQYIQNQIAGKSSYTVEGDLSISTSSVYINRLMTSADITKYMYGYPAYAGGSSMNVYNRSKASLANAISRSQDSNGNTYVTVYSCNTCISGQSEASILIYNSDKTQIAQCNPSKSGSGYDWNTGDIAYDTYKLNVGTQQWIWQGMGYAGISTANLVAFLSSAKVWNSKQDYVNYCNATNLYKIQNKVYGNTSSSKALPDSISVTDDSYTKQIQNAVTSATTSDSTLTDAQLDEIAAKVIQGINTTSTTTTDTTADTSSITSAIQSVFDNITNGNSILKTIADALTTAISIPIISIKTIVGNLSDSLVEYFPSVLEYLKVIANPFPKVAENIQSLVTSFPKVIENLESLVTSFPKIQDWINSISIPFPDVMSISIPETLSKALADILAAIQSLFVVDTVAVGTAAAGLQNVWNDHLPFIPKLQNIFSNLNFSSSYDYPVIKIQTPKILLQFYNKEYIILLDFKDYAYYFLWTRNIIRAMLWIGFAYSVFKHFRVRFHIG